MIRPQSRLGGPNARSLLGGVVAVGAAAWLFWPYGLNGTMSRDEGIYSYAGQQLAGGTPPYVSIFDPKGPVSPVIAGVSAWLGQVTGHTDYYLIRLAFFAFSLLAVLAVFLLATRLFGDRLAGLTAALVLALTPAFAMDALPGPDAKTPTVFFVVVAMLLLTERRWFWAGLTTSLAVLSWQPAVFYALDAVLVAAVLGGPRGRWRAVCRVVVGGLVPLVVTVAGFAAVGALDDFVAATVSYPLTGAPGGDGGVAGSTRRLWEVVDKHAGGPLFWLGWVLLLVVVAMGVATHRPVRRALQQPLVCVVLVTGVAELLFATTNFQGYPDTYPLLPYVCLGYGGAVALARRARWGWVRVATAAVVLVALAAVTVVRWHEAHLDPSVGQLSAQRSDACGLDRIVVPGTSLYSIGDPVPLVLTHRTNPDRYIYLGMAVDVWKLRHSSGGLGGWLRSIQRSDPSVIVFQSYSGRYSDTLKTMIRQSGFHRRYLGEWRVFLTSEARARARAEGVRLTRHRTPVATSRHGRRPLPAFHCQHINDATGGSRA